ncbi:hypothetical protein R1sor_012583 [Riccia sorocarpa]|uniref:MULE transposase domain-containing protein n=1 Tax=Riccia sorocarpa TaxID=122646 RepID=A0ABD3I466_9MARC
MEEYEYLSGGEWSPRGEWNEGSGEEREEEIESEEETIHERIDAWTELNSLRWFSELSVIPEPIVTNVNRVEQESAPTLLAQWQASAAAAAKKKGPRLNLQGKTLREVEEVADRIKLGETFVSFHEFEYCFDCWCALHLRSSHKSKICPTCRVRVCRYGRPVRKAGVVGRVTEWPAELPQPEVTQGPSAAGTRSFGDFRRGRQTPSQPIRNHERPDLNLLSQDFTPVPTSRKKKRCDKGECGEKSRYDAAGMDASNAVVDWEVTEQIGADLAEGNPSQMHVGHRCDWRVRCSYLIRSQKYQITVADLNHSCPGNIHGWRGPLASATWLAEVFGNRIALDFNRPMGQLLNEFRANFYKEVNYPPMFRMRQRCQDELTGADAHAFSQIPDLLDMIQEADPRAIVNYSTVDGVFTRAFVCPSATQGVLRFCQKMIAMDACHTKKKKYPTLLVLATTVDGNNNIIVLAYGIAPVEDRETWCWFVGNLKHAIHGLASPNVLIVSDRQKGLVDAVADELPSNEHVHCTFHLRMNLKRYFGAQVSQYFHRLIYTETKDIFEDALKDLEERFPNGKETVQYINGIDRTKFARYAMKLPRYGRVTSNSVECMNGAFLKLRVYAARRLIFEVWTYMMRKFYKWRVAAETSFELLTKYAKDRLSEFEREFGRYITCNSDQNVALVQTNGGAEQFVVNRLPRLSCTCFEPHEMLWPCIHVMSWCRSKGEDYLQFVDRIYFQKSLATCYTCESPMFRTNHILRPSTLSFNSSATV